VSKVAIENNLKRKIHLQQKIKVLKTNMRNQHHLIKDKSFLITGGASLVGSHIADELLIQGAKEVRLFDNFSLSTTSAITHLLNHPRVPLIKGDVLRMNELIDAAKGVDGVFAMAGFLTIPMAKDPVLGVSVNTMGMVNTLEACRINGVRRIVFSSSVATYGNPVESPVNESAPYCYEALQPPSLLYGASKLMGEALCAQYAKAHGLEFNVLRFSSVYGERQHARALNAVFVAQVCDKVRAGLAPVIGGDGSEVHDYVYVTDVAQACALAMTSYSHGHILNIATGIDTTHSAVAEIALKICGRFDLKPEYQADTRTVKPAASSVLGFSREAAKNNIDWEPKVDVQSGIARLIEWQKNVSHLT